MSGSLRSTVHGQVRLRLCFRLATSFGSSGSSLGTTAYSTSRRSLRFLNSRWSCFLFRLLGFCARFYSFDKFAVRANLSLDLLLLGSLGFLLCLSFHARVTVPVFIVLHLFEAETPYVGNIRAAVAADDIATVLADHAIFIPFARRN